MAARDILQPRSGFGGYSMTSALKVVRRRRGIQQQGRMGCRKPPHIPHPPAFPPLSPIDLDSCFPCSDCSCSTQVNLKNQLCSFSDLHLIYILHQDVNPHFIRWRNS
ncbi:hypothetical protein CDAR_103021 [Caerostris darwini]|uniref:Uncharacterized protein n=1 Tax=Caerostris darwini TaxID=1538125 RepID=A0AAV4V331_9ARAC|nr:hypothetical protein CDAR_103021 [Caerostris darwini]